MPSSGQASTCLAFFKLRLGALIPRFVGRSVCLSVGLSVGPPKIKKNYKSLQNITKRYKMLQNIEITLTILFSYFHVELIMTILGLGCK